MTARSITIRCPACGEAYETPPLAGAARTGASFDLRSVTGVSAIASPIYTGISICPSCDFALFREDVGKLRLLESSRTIWMQGDRYARAKVFLDEGGRPPKPVATLGAYLVAAEGYSLALGAPLPVWHRRGLATLRAAWVAEDLLQAGERRFAEIHRELRAQARSYLEMSMRTERLQADAWYGPDADHDFGAASVPYLLGVLTAEQLDIVGDAEEHRALRKTAMELLQSVLTEPSWQKHKVLVGFAQQILQGIRERFERAPSPAIAVSKSASASDRKGVGRAAEPEDALLLSEDIRLRLAALMPTHGRSFAPGEVIIKQGDRTGKMLYICSGRAAVRLTHKGQTIEVGESGPGQIVGEVAALVQGPHMASVIARTKVDAVVLPGDFFETLAMTRPQTGLSLARSIAERFTRLLRKL